MSYLNHQQMYQNDMMKHNIYLMFDYLHKNLLDIDKHNYLLNCHHKYHMVQNHKDIFKHMFEFYNLKKVFLDSKKPLLLSSNLIMLDKPLHKALYLDHQNILDFQDKDLHKDEYYNHQNNYPDNQVVLFHNADEVQELQYEKNFPMFHFHKLEHKVVQ